jgi:hypothetical protein
MAMTMGRQRSLAELDPILLQRIARSCGPNDAASLRGACRLFRNALSAHTAIQLAESVPEAVFAEHFSRPGAVRELSLRKRRKRIRLVIQSGSIANLQLLLVGPTGGDEPGTAGCTLTAEDLAAAAASGQLAACQVLRSLGCPWDRAAPAAAAKAGHQHILQWLLAEGCPRDEAHTLASAAKAGQAAIVEALLERGQRPSRLIARLVADAGCYALAMRVQAMAEPAGTAWTHAQQLLPHVAYGCSADELLALVAGSQPPADLPGDEGGSAREAAAAQLLEALAAAAKSAAVSPTSDWRQKCELLAAAGAVVQVRVEERGTREQKEQRNKGA